MTRLILATILLGLCSIEEGKSQKLTRSIESEAGVLLRDNIDASQVYQKIKLKRENEVNNFSEDEKLLRRMLIDTSIPIDDEKWGVIGDRIIAQADVSEETKRVVRQVKKQRPGFFWTLFRVLFETVNETRSVIQQINDIVSNNVIEGTTPRISSLPSTSNTNASENDLLNMTSTTEAPFKLTRQFLQDFTRRNIRGLVRLFNVEWKDALNQSQNNIKQFQKDLAQSVEPFLADNPDAY